MSTQPKQLKNNLSSCNQFRYSKKMLIKKYFVDIISFSSQKNTI